MNALCEREFGGIIDRHRLAARVAFPTVAAAFASAAGVFFPAERAADFRAARADIHIGNAAIASATGKKLLRLAQIIRENRGTEPLRHGVVRPDGLFKPPIADEIKNGGEGFFLDDLEIVLSGGDAWPDIAPARVGGSPQPLAAVE